VSRSCGRPERWLTPRRQVTLQPAQSQLETRIAAGVGKIKADQGGVW